ncbi:LCP family protein [Streptomyces spiramenti]|uniref:LCP family protein n=1 Tax=Streptomyces spiramenti TaxID=2720606 RepID=A0ABX1AT00_9ACTN|nr:LCP family protein [Streptomyces spiramenti]NJP68861.1 LCP family protein [Streptomyces spiramenti]
MNDWPEGWTEQPHPRRGRGGPPQPEGARVMPHVSRQAPPGQGGYGQGPAYGDHRYDRYEQPNAAPHRAGGGYGPPPGYDYDDRDDHRPRPNWGRRIKWTVISLVMVMLVTGVGTYLWADSKLRREVDLSVVEERPDGGKGTNYLIVGTDSREGLTAEERESLRTGHSEGARADTMMILHTGSNGNSLVSLPRDSWVTIPEFTGSSSGNRIPASTNKLNAAYAMEGPELLVRTVEYNTGLRIDNYAEIGFGGFASVVDALGGVEMCFEEAVQDKNSGADFEAGCQDLDGGQSLAFVRQRYQEAMGDLGRTQNQQKFLGALGNQVASPATLLNPFKLYPTMGASLDSLIVDEEMSVFELGRMFLALRGVQGDGGTQMNVPVADPGYATDKGSAVLWDKEAAAQLFEQLKADESVTGADG